MKEVVDQLNQISARDCVDTGFYGATSGDGESKYYITCRSDGSYGIKPIERITSGTIRNPILLCGCGDIHDICNYIEALLKISWLVYSFETSKELCDWLHK